MVLRFAILLLFGLSLAACSMVQKQEVVAVEAASSGKMAKTVTRRQTSSTPAAVQRLLDQAEDKLDSNLAEAYQILSKAQRLAPNEPRVYFLLGVFYFEQDQLKKAQAMFQKVLAFDAADWRGKSSEYLERILNQ